MVSPKTRSSALIQDVFFLEHHPPVRTSTNPASCYACGKGLEDGHSVTAKKSGSGIIFLCDVHYSLQ